MPAPNEKLAASLAALKQLQDAGTQAIPGKGLSRVHRERLLTAGYLVEVLQGWYVPARPNEQPGSSTAWFAHIRDFVTGYCNQRFGDAWHLNPETSLSLHSGERTLPPQLIIWAPAANNQVVSLPYGTSLLLYRAPNLLPAQPAKAEAGMRLVAPEHALAAVGGSFFAQQPLAAQLALHLLPDTTDLTRILLAGSRSVVAGRLAGALRAIGREDEATDLVRAMTAAGYDVRESNPFLCTPHVFGGNRMESPYAQRLRLLWSEMRETVIQRFPPPVKTPLGRNSMLEDIEARYLADAYHSLSIEGYRVTADLIERVRNGQWNPDGVDALEKNAMAAKGYFDAHTLVKADVLQGLRGANPGALFRRRLPDWYRALWGASVQAGILKPEDLAGYRNDQVFISNAQHVPLSKEAVRDCMPVLFELLEQEPHAGVRAVLGHLVFVYIHPYMDGNGRLARFLMNLMLTTGGYVWTVIPVERRTEYMSALEQASSHKDIAPFANLVAELVTEQTLNRPPRPAGR
ncbi:MAG: Fic family protein [Gammaproteobacteria bacterium]|nr:Fic family protein [Gammaproteobacteria bacterium]